ncbi:Fur family transcriptional regulator [Amphritea sp. 1_MG-2023]|uniref:Fur family transcriptional regulator n=1 Tax=Amphritea sp. 1_MG-2023 TaxID=3062670 RepID=UPI0026E32AB5|nr:Fur family transcriptional regulator [Amphritea sp. 1_MG-2023]MDO6562334.1 Fur family transcriptional regulator [Amphritea sp. 1_MG-2023]
MASQNSPNVAYQTNHDHNHCIKTALEHAHEVCQSNGQRLTKIRELVLNLIWQSHKPLGAYDLLPALAKAGFNSAPPTVYRALDFLQEQGLVHRLASLNSFIGCTHPGQQHHGYFLICSQCGNTAEMQSQELQRSILHCASAAGFSVEQEQIEILGRCPNCQESI